MLNDNNKQRKVPKRKRLLVILFFLVCFLAVIVVIMEYARVLRCSSTEGGWLRIDGCLAGSFCAEDFLCKHCANKINFVRTPRTCQNYKCRNQMQSNLKARCFSSKYRNQTDSPMF